MQGRVGGGVLIVEILNMQWGMKFLKKERSRKPHKPPFVMHSGGTEGYNNLEEFSFVFEGHE